MPSVSDPTSPTKSATEGRHLKRAPIREALIDFRVRVPKGTNVEDLHSLRQLAGPAYHEKGPIARSEFHFSAAEGKGPNAEARSSVIGLRFHSQDERYVAQFTLGGMTVSRLEPYETWEALRDETERLWDLYVRCLAPVMITRVATRFINSVQFPLRHGDNLETYLAAPPRVPESLPQGVSSFLQRVVVQDAQTQASIIVTQLLEPPLEETPPPVILDLDAFREAEFAPGGREAWACLEELRGLKNRFFFASLTARALESYS